MQTQELLHQLLDEIRGAWRFRWLGLAVAWGICLIGWLVVFRMPDTYEANARVFVDTRSILRPLLEGLAVNPDVASGLDLVRAALLSRPNIEKVARETDLDLRARTPQQRDALVRSIQERIKIEGVDARATTRPGEGLYRIGFQDHDRTKSIVVVQTLLNAFVEDALGEKRIGQETAERFLDEQIADHERRLTEAEARLADFKKNNVGMMPDNRGDYFTRLQEETAVAEGLRTQLAVAESRRTEIQRQLAGEEPFLFGFDSGAESKPSSGAAGDLTFRIQDLEKTLDELLLRYTEKHPEVVSTRSTLEELRRRQAEELARIQSSGRGTGSLSSSLKSNPIYQNLEIELNRTQVRVAELRQELAQANARVAGLRRRVDTVPEVEAELSRLNRDYDVTRQRYLELVQRREKANISQDADRTGTVKFQVIDPPAADFKPIAPNRPFLLAAVLLLGLAAGGGATWVINQIRPVFHSVRTLADVTGQQVLAAVSRTFEDQHRRDRKQEVWKFSAAMLALVGLYAAISFVQGPGAAQLQRLMG
ncbi:MAG: XrtA system polysaccharide chain length determinant [Steroidobacteraceae bacterium]